MKSLRAKKSLVAKTSLSFGLSMLIASTAALRADDQAKDKAQSADSRNLPSDARSLQRDQTQSDRSSVSDSQGGTGSATGSQAGKLSSLDNQEEKFIREAAKGGMMEVQMGKLGVQKAQNSQVKQFAQRLVDDHTKANTELRQLASKKGINLPQENIAESSSSDRSRVREKTDSDADHSAHSAQGEHKAHMKRLEQLSGAEFDREFVRMAVTDHQKDVKEFEKQAQKASDPDVKEFAQKTAPILREHLQQAKSLQSQVGQGSGTGQGAAGSESTSTSGEESSSSSSGSEGNSSSGSSKSSGTGSGVK